MIGFANPYVIGGLALALLGAYAGGRVHQKINDAKEIGACELSNTTFKTEQDRLTKKGIEDAAALKQSQADMITIATAQHDTVVRINNIPLDNTDCPTKITALKGEAKVFQNKHHARSAP